jgi:hypothetical protein
MVSALAVACAGGGEGTTGLPPGGNSGLAQVRIVIPNPATATNAAVRRVLYVSASTQGVLLSASPAPGSGGQPAILAVNLASPTPPAATCTASPSGSRTCTIQFPLVEGPSVTAYQLQIATYDATPAPASGFPAGAHLLGLGAAGLNLQPGVAPTPVSVTLGGVVASATIVPPTPTPGHAIAPGSFAFGIGARDADGNLIVGPWVDANGNPVTIPLVVASILPGPAASGEFTVALPKPTPTGSNATPSYVGYDAQLASNAQMANGMNVTLEAIPIDAGQPTPSSGLPTPIPGATPAAVTLALPSPVPSLIPYPSSLGSAMNNASVLGIATDQSGNVWFTATNNTGPVVAELLTAGGTPQFSSTFISNAFSGSSCTNSYKGQLNAMTLGPDGNLWFTGSEQEGPGSICLGVPVLVSVSPSSAAVGTITNLATLSANAFTGTLSSIVTGPGGDLWFIENFPIGLQGATYGSSQTATARCAPPSSTTTELAGLVADPNSSSTLYTITVTTTGGSIGPALYAIQPVTITGSGATATCAFSTSGTIPLPSSVPVGSLIAINQSGTTVLAVVAASAVYEYGTNGTQLMACTIPSGYSPSLTAAIVGPDGNLWVANGFQTTPSGLAGTPGFFRVLPDGSGGCLTQLFPVPTTYFPASLVTSAGALFYVANQANGFGEYIGIFR